MSLLREINKGLRGLRRSGRSALQGSFSTAAAFFRCKDQSQEVFCRFIRFLLTRSSGFNHRAEALFTRSIEDTTPDINAMQIWQEVKTAPLCTEDEIVRLLSSLSAEKREQFITFAASLVHLPGGFPEAAEKLEGCVRKTGMTEEKYQQILEDLLKGVERRRRMLRSGTGIIAALIVITVFILTATLLRSVIFGLIVAYLLLPLEQYLERSWRQKKGLGYLLGTASSFLWWLPRKLAADLNRKASDNAPTPEELARKEEQKIISRAVGQTVLAVLIAVSLFSGGIYMLSAHYLKGIGAKFRPATVQQSSPAAVDKTAAKAPGTGTAAAANKKSAAVPQIMHAFPQLQKIREKLLSVPVVRYLADQAEKSLRDEHTRHELTSMLWRRSGGVFSFLANVMGFFGTLICDVLLTVFFGMLFLMKMAEFKSSANSDDKGNFAVRSILLSRWLPNVSENTLTEAQRILSGVFSRLRIWVRGYLTLVIIDSTVYTILFGLLELPYFPILGIIAGCGILLPYVGPILSCALTLLVTYLAGDPGITQLGLILCCYLIYNGIIEQFILYPMVIGESLGLTTLETIIVVLLGAIFAGIAGMILALPAASVIKYLVPQIYRCWDVAVKNREKNTESSGA